MIFKYQLNEYPIESINDYYKLDRVRVPQSHLLKLSIIFHTLKKNTRILKTQKLHPTFIREHFFPALFNNFKSNRWISKNMKRRNETKQTKRCDQQDHLIKMKKKRKYFLLFQFLSLTCQWRNLHKILFYDQKRAKMAEMVSFSSK